MSGDLAAAWSKLESYAARLALVIQLVAEPEAQAVGQPAINAGVTLARWFANEARHVYGRFAEGEAQRELRHLAERVERKGGSVTIRDWQRSRSLSKAEDAKAELGKLAEADLGYWDTTPHSGPGRPCERFTLDKTPRTDTDNTDKTPDGDRDSSIVSVSSVSVEGFYSPEPASEDGFWSEQGVI